MKISVTQLPETKEVTVGSKVYRLTYSHGFPVTVRRVWHCTNCNVEVGGYFGNKVYGDIDLKLCNNCKHKNDPISLMCIAQTGMTPEAYQLTHGVAWNE